MATALIVAVAVGFGVMGLVGLARPERILGYFGMGPLTSGMRNEVRAVYGGFGLSVAGLLIAALEIPSLREGILISLAVAVGGMALGRCVSLALERPEGRWPVVFLGMEVIMAIALVEASLLLQATGAA